MNKATLLLALLVLAGGPSMVSIADDAPPAAQPESHDPDAVAYLKALEDAIQKQTDEQAVASVKRLVGYWKDATVKAETKKPIPGLVAWYARRKTADVALAGVAGLGDIGKGEGAKQLVAVLDAVLVKDDSKPDELGAAVTDAVFATLKKVADPDAAVTAPIVKLFVHPNDAVVAKAADVFGGYGKAPVDVRRELFEQMLRSFEGVASQAQAAPKNVVNKSALNKWSVIGGGVMGAMTALSRQSFETMAAARAWFNDHKKDVADWK